MSDIFVSYKAEDRPRVRPLVEALQADGLSVWWDAHIEGGDDWRESIATNLDSAKCVIVTWSKRSTGPEGRFVRDEAARAVKRAIYLPVTIDKVDPPLGFGETQCLPLSGWKGSRDDPRYLMLLDRARHIIGDATRPSQAVRPDRAMVPVSRRGALVGGAVASLAVAGGAGWYFLRGSSAAAASVAVLPFANLSGDPGQAYFSDGLSEELRSSLARIPGLRVMARTSSEMLRDSDAKSAAAKLGVATILSGSVRRSPTTIRVSAQLIDGSSGLERWSQTFDRAPGDVLAVQTNIAENVAQQLRAQFGASDRAALDIGGTNNAEAQDLFLRSKEEGRPGDEAAFRNAIALTDAAIRLDPNYAAAYAAKGLLTALGAAYYAPSAAASRAGIALGEAAARKAIALQPKLAEAHDALGVAYRQQCKIGGYVAELAEAAASPGCAALVLADFSIALTDTAQFARARAILQPAFAQDPLNPDLVGTAAYISFRERRFAEAIAGWENYLGGHPEDVLTRDQYAQALLFSGRTEDAARQFAQLPANTIHRLIGEAALAAKRGDKAPALERLDSIRARFGNAANYQYAQIFGQVGDVANGLAALEAAWTERDTGLPLMKVDPYLDPLRQNARFGAVMAKLGFPET